MTPRKTPLSTRLGELGEAIVSANQRAREAELEHGRVKATVAQVTEDITDAYAAGDNAKAAKLSKERARLEGATLREAEERLEGARRAVQRAEVECATFAAESINGLLSEHAPDAQAAASAVERAVEQLGQAHSLWNSVEAEIASLLRLNGNDTGTLPRFPQRLADLVRDARRADVSVPVPLPRGLAPASITPHDAPDPDVQ